MTTDEAIAIICKAINPSRQQGDDGLPSMEQGIVAMYIRSYMDDAVLPIVGAVSKTATDSPEAYELRQAIIYILQSVRAEAKR